MYALRESWVALTLCYFAVSAIIESFVGSFSLEIVGFAEEAHGNYSHDLCHGEKVQNEIITVTFQYGESSYVISPREPPAEIPLRVDNLFPYDFELHLERRAVANSVQHGQDRLPVEVLPLREVRIIDDAATGYEDHTSVELSFASFNSRMYRVIVNVMWRHR